MTKIDRIDFIGIGAAKSGSSWLSECLRQHPDIILPGSSRSRGRELKPSSLRTNKELDFFTVGYSNRADRDRSNRRLGLTWYLNQFAPAGPGQVRGEFSPVYLVDPESPALIRATFPDVKLLAVLREPGPMIYSHYWYNRVLSLETDGPSFEESVARGDYLNRGRHYVNLKRYFDLFPPANIKVILLEDIHKDPARVTKEVYEFLGVRSDFLPANLDRRINASLFVKSARLLRLAKIPTTLLRRCGLAGLADRLAANGWLHDLYCRVNVGQGNYPPMNPETRKRLKEYYRDDILKLRQLIGRDLSAWL